MTTTDQDAWNYAKQNTQLSNEQLATGIVQHPVNGIWQVWVSLYGNDVSQIFASKHYSIAEAVQQQFSQKWNSNELMTFDEIADFCRTIKRQEGSEPVDPLPQSSVKKICQHIKDLKQHQKLRGKGFGK